MTWRIYRFVLVDPVFFISCPFLLGKQHREIACSNGVFTFHLTAGPLQRMFLPDSANPMETLMARLQAVGRLGKGIKRLATVAAYEDSRTDARVNDFCRNLQFYLGEGCLLTKQLWLVNELRMPQLRAIAATEAAAADLVILAIHHTQTLPAEVRQWIDLWINEKRRRPVIVLALLDPSYRGDSACLKDYLSDASARGKVEFLSQAEDVAEED
jgi:hypothetical protein